VLGINASDINFTAGRYFPDPKKIKLPFDCGFESLGKIVFAGADVKRLKKGDFVLISGMNYDFTSFKIIAWSVACILTEIKF
jgi:NADPH:quinone reductase-like Zn-dependent oxidoreductase